MSGGQRQRLALARAYYKGAQVVVLDEATSALDEKTEENVMKLISDRSERITVIKVAHRMNTLESCDVIFEIENSRVSKVG